MSEIVKIENVKKVYPNVVALDDVNLTIEKGKIVGLLGPNGSGKTTLIKILVGLIKDFTGNIEIFGESLGYKSKAKVAYLPDHDFLSDRFNVRQAIEFYKEFFADFNEKKALNLLTQFNINLDRKVINLSKGNKEKLQLILTLSRNAELYVFDEPIAGVDPASRDVIFNLIMNNYSKGSTVIISTHLIQEVENILDEVIFIKSGKILTHQPKNELIEKHEKTIDALFREVFKC